MPLSADNEQRIRKVVNAWIAMLNAGARVFTLHDNMLAFDIQPAPLRCAVECKPPAQDIGIAIYSAPKAANTVLPNLEVPRASVAGACLLRLYQACQSIKRRQENANKTAAIVALFDSFNIPQGESNE